MIQLFEFFQYSFVLILKRMCLVRARRVRCGESGIPSTIIYTRRSSRRYELGCDAPVKISIFSKIVFYINIICPHLASIRIISVFVHWFHARFRYLECDSFWDTNLAPHYPCIDCRNWLNVVRVCYLRTPGHQAIHAPPQPTLELILRISSDINLVSRGKTTYNHCMALRHRCRHKMGVILQTTSSNVFLINIFEFSLIIQFNLFKKAIV